jgi:hypothetical protein
LADDLFLPEPEPREVRYTVISVDDHVVEPADTFEHRLPAALADRGPRIVETPEGHQVWEFEGQRYTQVAARRRTASSRSASTRCARAASTWTPACTTWTSTGSGRP